MNGCCDVVGLGCFLIVYGFGEEFGLFFINEGGEIFWFNFNVGNKVVNIVFVEFFVGVGFFYINISNDFYIFGDNCIGIEILKSVWIS